MERREVWGGVQVRNVTLRTSIKPFSEMAIWAQKKTCVHKTANVSKALGLNDFEAGKFITRAIVRVGL